ncbi:DinB family protein [Occallatibacter riparius]|uniref:DinB family protein n=1 Tax=Occallatibacter riparius TaxID=1002689 RepID=A0A9J7BWU3_9BACT|nr:DinB family protein [Occallatibacter riparius]UWZ86961.1 DinB family protein [Occallatibacter riparius]
MQNSVRVAGRVLAVCLLAGLPALSTAQGADSKQAKPAVGTAQPPAQIYGKLLSGMEKEFVDLAEAMPEDKYSFVPSTGEFAKVRSFGDQVKHIAEANWYFFGGPTITDEQLKTKSDAIEKLTSKADILQALKDSFKQAHALVDETTAGNAFTTTAHGTRAGMTSFGLAHMMDHYGQLVVYLRMNGIVPPASRGGNM